MDDEPMIEELCRPLSAKVMPRSALRSITGGEMNASRALMSQRKKVRSKPSTKPEERKDA